MALHPILQFALQLALLPALAFCALSFSAAGVAGGYSACEHDSVNASCYRALLTKSERRDALAQNVLKHGARLYGV